MAGTAAGAGSAAAVSAAAPAAAKPAAGTAGQSPEPERTGDHPQPGVQSGSQTLELTGDCLQPLVLLSDSQTLELNEHQHSLDCGTWIPNPIDHLIHSLEQTGDW